MKSQASVILHVLEGLFTDASLAYPELKDGFSRDYERIALYYRSRGIGLFTLDLPALDSLLTSGLESGRLSFEGPLCKRKSKKIQVPKLFSGLWLRVFDISSCLKVDADITSIAFLRQFFRLAKNLELQCSPSRIRAAVRSYADVERGLRTPTLGWDLDVLGFSCPTDVHFGDAVGIEEETSEDQASFLLEDKVQSFETNFDKKLLNHLQQVADVVSSSFPFLEPISFSMELEHLGLGIGFKHGPGAVAEQLKNHEKSLFPYWPAKLSEWFPFRFCAEMPGNDRLPPLNHEPSSRMHCVPKTAKGPRLIAAEPVAHQWCQQIVWRWLRVKMKETFVGLFIDFRRQDLSGDMVLNASADQKLATVDLSDASDRLTCWTVERMFRSNQSILSCLHAVRTRSLRQDISKSQDSFIKLKKFAAQGTATTFPVQSICFLIIALASCLDFGKVSEFRIRKLRNQVRVFGDDIIIPTRGYARLVHIMDLLQLKVNTAKSYANGHFRESCGVDGYRGYCVTPSSPKTFVADGPASCQAVVDTSNNLFNKGYWNAAHNLSSHIPHRVQRGLRIVGRVDAGFAGLVSFCGSDERHLTKRWNPRLHRFEGRVFSLRERGFQRDRQGYAPFLDFLSKAHNPEHARVVSKYGSSRKVNSDFLWEPLNDCALGSNLLRPHEYYEHGQFVRIRSDPLYL